MLRLSRLVGASPIRHFSSKAPAVQLKSLSKSLGRLLQHTPIHRIRETIDHSLDSYKHGPQNPPNRLTRSAVMERSIALLVSFRQFDEALLLYNRLTEVENYTPGPRTQALILTLSLGSSNTHEQVKETVPMFKQLFADPDYVERHLLHLIAVVGGLDETGGLGTLLIESFIEAKGNRYVPGGELVNVLVGLQSKTGLVDHALATLSRWDVSPPGKRRDATKSSHPYVSILSTLDPFDSESADKVMEAMQEKNIVMDNSVFNVLIRRETRRNAMHNAFGLYHALMDVARSQPNQSRKTRARFGPDAHTYRNLWTILISRHRPNFNPHNPKRRGLRSTIQRPEPDHSLVIPPRRLFLEMLETAFGQAWSPEKPFHKKVSYLDYDAGQTAKTQREKNPSFGSLTYRKVNELEAHQSLLTLALRYFLRAGDYPAAFVALGSFQQMKIPLTARVYFVLAQHFFKKMYWSLRFRKNQSLGRRGRTVGDIWGRRMLSRANVRPEGEKGGIKFDHDLLGSLLHLPSGLGLSSSASGDMARAAPSPPTDTRKHRMKNKTKAYNIPTHAQMSLQMKVPLNTQLKGFDVVPLQRILRRAIIAEWEVRVLMKNRALRAKQMMYELRREEEELQLNQGDDTRIVSQLILKAKEEMVSAHVRQKESNE